MVNAKFSWTGTNGKQYCTNNEGEGLFVLSRGNWEQVSGTFQFSLDKGTRTEIKRVAQHLFGPGTQIEPEADPVAAALGSRGGTVTSDAKSTAARENGKRGGRPRKNANA